jgi:DNA invertase Pin-like site-specific DNA recombinase
MPRRSNRKAASAEATTIGRTFSYVRVSSDEQVETGQSLAVQTQQLHGWAQMHGRAIAETFTEAGVSAADAFNTRPEGSRLWQTVQPGDSVVAAKLDRMFRSAADCLAVVEAFKARGVSLYLLDLNGGADVVSGNGIARLFLTIVSAFAEFERDRLGERIRATKRKQRADGVYSGGRPQFGWTYDAARKLVPVPEQQKAIKLIARLRGKGRTLRAIQAAVQKSGVSISLGGVAKVLAALERKAAA